MIDINLIRENPELVKKGAAAKRSDVDIDKLLYADEQRRKLIGQIQEFRAAQNVAGERIAKEKDADAKKAAVDEMRELKEKMNLLEAELADAETQLHAMLALVPNLPSDDTPVGPDESGNVVVRKVGEPTKFDFEPKDHVALGEALGLIDNETGSEVAGARFTYLKGDLALLQNALHQLALSILTNREALAAVIEEAGLSVPTTPFIPVIPPLMIKPEVFQRMARLEPREERYHIPSDDLFLIGSAEHTLGPIHMDETFKEADLPRRYVAFTPAFRREAGSYGKDTKGILRLHQFDKIEMESFSTPEQSRAEQDLFVAVQEHVLKLLGVPYQVVQVCTGDMGGPDSRQIDLESWMPGQGKYRETHTADLMTDYQARRLNTRVRRDSGEMQFVHMNDATCIAMGRLLIAIMENFQEADGSIHIPKALQQWMGNRTHIGK
ncbi:MAG TPA: serine--tRNA ligase [Candidatus Baltobacteraceae bacterium]|nr:serine--tRNA ligase [Candidatus Baltobacteraceae bacterium]